MKQKEIAQLRLKTLAELKKLLGEITKKIIKLKMETKTEKIKNVRQLARTKDDLARIMTIIRQKELEGQS